VASGDVLPEIVICNVDWEAMEAAGLTENQKLIGDAFDNESDMVKIFKKDKKLKIVLMSKNDDEFMHIFENYHELFDKIDNLVD
jgi:hypothetical protein